jgi:hypothetical protein
VLTQATALATQAHLFAAVYQAPSKGSAVPIANSRLHTNPVPEFDLRHLLAHFNRAGKFMTEHHGENFLGDGMRPVLGDQIGSPEVSMKISAADTAKSRLDLFW